MNSGGSSGWEIFRPWSESRSRSRARTSASASTTVSDMGIILQIGLSIVPT
ncbi:hypothetical protein ACFFX0_20545 [Citricoccus parietis]|uniref:Uncharacterized protein n=1 Tax=Citricoccus parietis TaxID=592307 RepID=A0ABV5G3E9_9MICC